jgi:uncharacterized protein (DUF1501 family)
MNQNQNPGNLSRRRFQQQLACAAGVAVGTSAPSGWLQLLANDLSPNTRDQSQEKVLVVIQWTGGNDGLNTVIPYEDDRYYAARPKLAIPKTRSISIAPNTALHPSLKPLEGLLADSALSIHHGVGYPDPNRSHFESMDIWHSCKRKKERSQSEGWLGKTIASFPTDRNKADAPAMHLGGEPLPMALIARGVQVPSLANVEQFQWKSTAGEKSNRDSMDAMRVADGANPTPTDTNDLLGFLSTSTQAAIDASQRISTALKNPDATGTYPDSDLGQKLKTIARLILAGFKTSIYYVSLDGFDTHANQPDVHASLLKQWSEALAAFHLSMKNAGLADRVCALTFSEFGRRVAENASDGTDHGAAAPIFLSGPQFEKPIVGLQPSLNDLDDGDLKHSIDFRSVYTTLIEEWFGLPSESVLGSPFPKLASFVKKS